MQFDRHSLCPIVALSVLFLVLPTAPIPSAADEIPTSPAVSRCTAFYRFFSSICWMADWQLYLESSTRGMCSPLPRCHRAYCSFQTLRSLSASGSGTRRVNPKTQSSIMAIHCHVLIRPVTPYQPRTCSSHLSVALGPFPLRELDVCPY